MAAYRLAFSPDVVARDDGVAVFAGTPEWEDYQAWLERGNEPDPYVAPGQIASPTFADYVTAFTAGLQAWMEQTAHSNAYDSVLSCVSYKDSGVPQFAGDARAMIDWRDALWRWASAWQAGFNGQLPATLPTMDEVKAMAPQPEAFGWVVHPPGQIIEAIAPVEQTS